MVVPSTGRTSSRTSHISHAQKDCWMRRNDGVLAETSRQEKSKTERFLEVSYQPRWPATFRPPTALIGCGGITRHHLEAYRAANLPVVALCDIERSRAEERQRQFYPDAQVYTDYRELLRRDDIAVVDIATHPQQRVPIIEAALRARKHVLSQKPFVLDLATGRKLARLADRYGVHLAVNQNGRWAPHWSYARELVRLGLFGEIHSVSLSNHWNHGWIAGTPFDRVKHVILFDYAIHWFDILRCFLPDEPPRRVYAALRKSKTQVARPALLAQVCVEYPGRLASLVFHADTRFASQDRTIISGSEATLISLGPNEKNQTVSVHLPEGAILPRLTGCWFPDGFSGTMGELLLAIEENRAPSIDAADNLKSLELCFAAVASAERGEPVKPGTVQRIAT
ncbi:MAG: NADH-dependent dehydrogenase [Pirellulaceae bacterium]|nr:MAG: NADH-dependent dehydrogenase [Pirellulaceae bacterium]